MGCIHGPMTPPREFQDTVIHGFGTQFHRSDMKISNQFKFLSVESIRPRGNPDGSEKALLDIWPDRPQQLDDPIMREACKGSPLKSDFRVPGPLKLG